MPIDEIRPPTIYPVTPPPAPEQLPLGPEDDQEELDLDYFDDLAEDYDDEDEEDEDV